MAFLLGTVRSVTVWVTLVKSELFASCVKSSGDGNGYFYPTGAKHKSHPWDYSSERQLRCTVTEALRRGCQNQVRTAARIDT